MVAHRGKFVGYFRVSTERQGRSGLGLEAQREAVMAYLNGGSWTMVAEFVEHKRHADAIRAFAKVAHPRAKLLLAGTGSLHESMKKLSAKLGTTGRVHFLGQRSDVPVLMKACRALVLPSSREGLPRCILEAMSMGVPVIGSRIRGITELLERNAGGKVQECLGANIA